VRVNRRQINYVATLGEEAERKGPVKCKAFPQQLTESDVKCGSQSIKFVQGQKSTMGKPVSAKSATFLDRKSTSTEVANQFGGAAAERHAIVTGLCISVQKKLVEYNQRMFDSGGNSGIGLETARVLAKSGSVVTIASRSAKNGDEAVASIKAEFPLSSVSAMVLDLTSFASVRKFAADYKATGKPIHLMINNAGVMACPKTLTSEGLEMQFGTNHIGHFLLTTLLLDLIKTSGTAELPARIVNVSSDANYFAPAVGIHFDDLTADKSYSRVERYGSSKLANILFTRELQRRLSDESAPVVVVSLHPGIIGDTKLQRYVNLAAVPSILGFFFTAGWDRLSMALRGQPMKSIPQGAATTLYCALAPEVVQHGGAHYSDCQLDAVVVHRTAGDPKMAERLWAVSEQIVNK